VATANNRQARTHHRHADQATITRRQAGLAPGPLTRSMRGVMQSTKGVVKRTGHPHDHDRADAHGNANACEHVGHLRVGRRRGTSSRRHHSNLRSSSMTAGARVLPERCQGHSQLPTRTGRHGTSAQQFACPSLTRSLSLASGVYLTGWPASAAGVKPSQNRRLVSSDHGPGTSNSATCSAIACSARSPISAR
jgi:hypothetical protein